MTAPVAHPDLLFIDGEWVEPSSKATIDVIDSNSEELYYTVAEANASDMDRAITAARNAFDNSPWPFLSPAERADHLRAFGKELAARSEALGDIWPRESGVLAKISTRAALGFAMVFDYYASLADTFEWETRAQPTMGGKFGLLVREPVGVVGAIIPWNAPLQLAVYKIAPALLAGCTVVLKTSPEAPGAGLVLAEAAEAAGIPAGVFNTLTADRAVSEQLVTDPRIDKIAFTGSTAAGRRIASLCGERIARYTLELGGKSAAVILDDADIAAAAASIAGAECMMTGQVCSSLTRLVVPRNRHDELVDAIAANFSQVVVGDPCDKATQMGPLAMERQREKVLGLIEQGKIEATLITGGGKPAHLDKGFYVEPTLFAGVDNSHTIAREEIFGPVLSVIPADSEDEAIRIANDTIYGLNASVFTADPDRARGVAAKLRSGTVGHNGFRTDFGIAFGGFKQSGIGREGGVEGLHPYLETKTVILEGTPSAYA